MILDRVSRTHQHSPILRLSLSLSPSLTLLSINLNSNDQVKTTVTQTGLYFKTTVHLCPDAPALNAQICCVKG